MPTNLDPTPPELAARLSAVVGRRIPLGLAYSDDGLVIRESDLLTVVQLLEEADRAAQKAERDEDAEAHLSVLRHPTRGAHDVAPTAVKVRPGETVGQLAARVARPLPQDDETSVVLHVRLAARS